MPEQPVAKKVLRDRVNDHLAVRAWRTLHSDSIEPETITVLEQEQSTVYKLKGVDAGGSALIAKARGLARLVVERTVYQQVLALHILHERAAASSAVLRALAQPGYVGMTAALAAVLADGGK